MPKVLSFTDRGELVATLRSVNWEQRIDEINAERQSDIGPLTAVFESVGSSTFRAFRRSRHHKPSVVFRSCVSEALFNCGVSDLRKVASNEDYRAWALHIAQKLERSWKDHLPNDLNLPKAMKLVNLLAKGFARCRQFGQNKAEL